MSDCIRDDITECDCPRCAGNAAAWERVQGWDADDGVGNDDGPDDDDDDQPIECAECGQLMDDDGNALCDACHLGYC